MNASKSEEGGKPTAPEKVARSRGVLEGREVMGVVFWVEVSGPWIFDVVLVELFGNGMGYREMGGGTCS